MRTYLPIVIVFMVSCGGLRPPTPTVPDSAIKRVEEAPLPPDPSIEPPPDGVPSEEWVEPHEPGTCSGKPGILISEGRAARDARFRIRYRELRTICEVDREVWKAHRDLYETRLGLAVRTIQSLQPGWWDRNKFQLGVVGGMVIGVAASALILTTMNVVY